VATWSAPIADEKERKEVEKGNKKERRSSGTLLCSTSPTDNLSILVKYR
jgi:hypothetical protein